MCFLLSAFDNILCLYPPCCDGGLRDFGCDKGLQGCKSLAGNSDIYIIEAKSIITTKTIYIYIYTYIYNVSRYVVMRKQHNNHVNHSVIKRTFDF